MNRDLIIKRYFTIDEAKSLLPELRHLVLAANKELDAKAFVLQDINRRYLAAEAALDESVTPEEEDENSLTEFRALRTNFEAVISELSLEQGNFLRCMENWVDRISFHGVILRKLKEGLLDFPARKGEFEYFLCWQVDEGEIKHWHLRDDGFLGRKTLLTLSEYC